MSYPIINRIVTAPPPPGHRISFQSLRGTESIELTDLYERAGRVAAGLRRLGVGPGDRIGILAANRLEWVLLDLAALRAKIVTAGLDPSKFRPDQKLLDTYDLKLLFTDRGPTGEAIRPISDVRRLADGMDCVADALLDPYSPDEVTTLAFTSGSTGTPKAIAPRVDSIDACLRDVQEMFAHGPGDDLFCFLPLSLIQQRFWVYSAMCFGHDVTVSTYGASFAVLPTVRPTVVMGVPAFFNAAKRHIETENGPDALRAATRRLFGDRIRYLWTGSAPAARDTLRFFTSHGLPIYEGYGFTETLIVSKNHPGAHREGSVGRPFRDKHVGFDANGVISVRSDHPVCSAYTYGSPAESARVFPGDGVARGGDIGYLDDDGFLFIRGRADDVIVLDNGKKIVPRPMEEFMKASVAIEECVLFCPTQTQLIAVVSPATEQADENAIHARLARCNAAFGADEQISAVVIARDRFSIENGLLTDQLKPRRQRIFDVYRSDIQRIERESRVH